MHFFEVNSGKTGNVQQNPNTPSQKSIEEQLKEIDRKIAELRDSLDIHTSPEEFARIQKEIEKLQNQRYMLYVQQSKSR